MKPRRIHERTIRGAKEAPGLEMWGWIAGEKSYIGLGEPGGPCRGILEGPGLIRLAKAIARSCEKRATPTMPRTKSEDK